MPSIITICTVLNIMCFHVIIIIYSETASVVGKSFTRGQHFWNQTCTLMYKDLDIYNYDKCMCVCTHKFIIVSIIYRLNEGKERRGGGDINI